jgi:GNAT superfamily N-acetyltransferase
MEIRIDDLRGREIAALLESHLDHMATLSPPDTVHALDLESLRVPEVTFWTMWDGADLLGCGALKELDQTFAEIKSMYTVPEHRGKGVAEGWSGTFSTQPGSEDICASALRPARTRNSSRRTGCTSVSVLTIAKPLRTIQSRRTMCV